MKLSWKFYIYLTWMNVVFIIILPISNILISLILGLVIINSFAIRFQ